MCIIIFARALPLFTFLTYFLIYYFRTLLKYLLFIIHLVNYRILFFSFIWYTRIGVVNCRYYYYEYNNAL